MQHSPLLFRCLVVLCVVVGSRASGASFTFQTVSLPGAVDSYAAGINDSGAIAGAYATADGTFNGFVQQGGQTTTFLSPGLPGYSQSAVTGINNAGQVTGGATLSAAFQGLTAGFVWTGGNEFNSFATNVSTLATGINNLGDVVLVYQSGFPSRGYSANVGLNLQSGSEEVPQLPGSLALSGPSLMQPGGAGGVNDQEQFVGSYRIDSYFPLGPGSPPLGDHGFLATPVGPVVNGVRMLATTTVDMPGISGQFSGTYPKGINNADEIVGYFDDSATAATGFVDQNGVFSVVNYPGSSSTELLGVNNSGQIVGEYTLPGNSTTYAFVADPAVAVSTPEPAAVGLCAIGSILLLIRRRWLY